MAGICKDTVHKRKELCRENCTYLHRDPVNTFLINVIGLQKPGRRISMNE